MASCGLLETTDQDGPEIRSFSASPERVQAGEAVLLSWRVDGLAGGNLQLHSIENGSTSRAVQDVTGQSKLSVAAWRSTTYRLQASSPRGQSSKETQVSVIDEHGGGEPGDPDEPPEEIPEPSVSYFESSTTEGQPGSDVTLSWATLDAQRVELDPPGVGVAPSGEMVVQPFVTTTYVLSASNDSGSSRAEVTVTVDEEGGVDRILLVIAGQSNASGSGLEEGGDFPTGATEQPVEGVHMLTPDWQWVQAEEPIHAGYEHSFGLRLGKEVRSATGAEVFLVPVAQGGSGLNEWERGDAFFEDAVKAADFASESLGVPVSAIVWFQGETETKYSSTRREFIDNTDSVLQALRSEAEGSPGVIFVQLAKRLYHGDTGDESNVEGHNLAYQEIREKQRLMEAGARELAVGDGSPGASGAARSHYHMVVGHDLPMSDDKHVSAEGQRYLGQRIANTFLSEIWSGSVDGTVGKGPRLESVTLADGGRTVLVNLSREVNESSNYAGYFTVFSGGTVVTPTSIGRDSDPTRIRIEFSSPLGGDVDIRYMPPAGTDFHTWTRNAVHSTVGGLRLPLPAFGGPVEELPREYFPGARLE